MDPAFPASSLPLRAPYAADPSLSRGRRVWELPSRTRNDFQRDRDRIIHSTAFRRLAYKTQVFVPDEDDHFRTRLTHTIEVSQIARALARALALDVDLAETLALAHDLGHTPFGHTGEDALDACLADYGGFDHNSHALRIVTELERRYATFDGLNLTWESLEGLVKHNGPLVGVDGASVRKRALPEAIRTYDRNHSLQLMLHPSAEAQCATIADDVAYNAHDIDDGLRAGLFTLSDLKEVDFLASLIDEVKELYPGLQSTRVVHEVGRRIITRLVEDVIDESTARLEAIRPENADAVRAAGFTVIGFSTPMQVADAAMKAFLIPRMYRHARVKRERVVADRVVRSLFAHYMEHASDLPEEWSSAGSGSTEIRARTVGDYIAGMTDRYALKRFEAIFDQIPELR